MVKEEDGRAGSGTSCKYDLELFSSTVLYRVLSFASKILLTLRCAQDSWDEGFLRELVGRLKRKGKDAAPWRDNEERCRKYHEHDRWSPMCEGVTVLKEE